MKFLLDADVVIDFVRAVPATIALLTALEGRGESFAVCDVVVTELYSGLHPSDHERAEQFLEGCEYLVISTAAAKRAGGFGYAYARQGTALAPPDVLITAVAESHGCAVITGNVRHFPMPEVVVMPLPRPSD